MASVIIVILDRFLMATDVVSCALQIFTPLFLALVLVRLAQMGNTLLKVLLYVMIGIQAATGRLL